LLDSLLQEISAWFSLMKMRRVVKLLEPLLVCPDSGFQRPNSVVCEE